MCAHQAHRYGAVRRRRTRGVSEDDHPEPEGEEAGGVCQLVEKCRAAIIG
jgi:hypothetical protein